MWRDLSIRDKADFIHKAVREGYNSGFERLYDEGGFMPNEPQPEEPPMGRGNQDNYGNYLQWIDLLAQKKSEEWDEPYSFVYIDMLNNNTYDYKAFYDEDPQSAWEYLSSPEGAHFDDVGKTVYHPSFSNESMYSANNYGDMGTGANPRNITGPSWNENDQLIDAEGNVVFDENMYDTGGPIKRQGAPDDWMRWWYAYREPQLINNFNNYYQIEPSDSLNENMGRSDEIYGILDNALEKVKSMPVRTVPLKPEYNGYFYDDADDRHIIMNIGASDDAILHEKTHALNSYIGDWEYNKHKDSWNLTSPIFSNIDVTTDDLYEDEEGWKYDYDEYLDNPNEVYSRLMQIRYNNRMLPNKKYSIDEIEQMRKEGKLSLPKSDGIERYSNKFIQYLFNDIADNNKESKNISAYGGGLRKYFPLGGNMFIDTKAAQETSPWEPPKSRKVVSYRTEPEKYMEMAKKTLNTFGVSDETIQSDPAIKDTMTKYVLSNIFKDMQKPGSRVEETMWDRQWTPSPDILEYIKKKEGFSPKAYVDANGVPTIGYGFTGNIYDKYKSGMTKQQADREFMNVANRFAKMFADATPNWEYMNPNMRDALFSYYYNIGHGNYTTKSKLLQQALREKNWEEAARQMDFGYNDTKNPGLRIRRQEEQKRFLTPWE